MLTPVPPDPTPEPLSPLAAVVELADAVDLTDVEEHCRERLAPFKVPSSWDVVEELPKTATGKIDKKVLRARFAAGTASER